MSHFNSQYDLVAAWVDALTSPSADLASMPLPEVENEAALPPLETSSQSYAESAGEAWVYHSDTTDIGIGGDDETFYLIDGDTSLILD